MAPFDVDDVQPRVLLEFFEQVHHVSQSPFPRSPLDELDRLPTLKVDAGNQHGSRSSTLCAREYSFKLRSDSHQAPNSFDKTSHLGFGADRNSDEARTKFASAFAQKEPFLRQAREEMSPLWSEIGE